MKSYILGVDELDVLAKEILSYFDKGVIILRGDLASGKTTLVKSIVKELGMSVDVTSPTFMMQHSYNDRVFHYDLYSTTLDKFLSLGMLEELEKDALHIVEWGNNELRELLERVAIKYIIIDIKKISKDKREYICTL